MDSGAECYKAEDVRYVETGCFEDNVLRGKCPKCGEVVTVSVSISDVPGPRCSCGIRWAAFFEIYGER